MSRPRLIFAHKAGHRSAGAKIMRVDQLSAMAAAHLKGRWDVEVLELPRPGQPRRQREMAGHVAGAFVIFLKRALDVLDLDNQWRWRDAARAIAIDYVDAEAAPFPKIPVDVHIAASGALERHLARRLSETPALARSRPTSVLRLDHHADPSLAHFEGAVPSNDLYLAYFGRAQNRTLPEALEAQVLHPAYGGLALEDATQLAMRRANMHYAVRDMAPEAERTAFKPFTKGITAAACHAHVLVNRQVDDAEDFLGRDYPFLIDDCSEEAVAAGIDKARGLAGTRSWADALDRMRAVRARVSPERIMAQLDGILGAAA